MDPNDTSSMGLAVAQTAGASPDFVESVGTHVYMASAAAGHGACLVVFPELSLTGYDLRLTSDDAVDPSDPRLAPLQAVADAHRIAVVAGAPVSSALGLHIGSLTFAPRRPVAVYLKRHLGRIEVATFVPGPGGDPVALRDRVVALAICAEITHPEHAEQAARGGATVYAASCLLSEEGYEADARLLRGYAKRHRMIVLMANYAPPVRDWSPAGRSAVWSADGGLVARAPAKEEALVVARSTSRGWDTEVVTRIG